MHRVGRTFSTLTSNFTLGTPKPLPSAWKRTSAFFLQMKQSNWQHSSSPKGEASSTWARGAGFHPRLPVEEATTPPSEWYTSSEVADAEELKVFGDSWQAVGLIEQIKGSGDYFTGSVGKVQYVVCRDGEGRVRAFHNVCRHHAAPVAQGAGCAAQFVCPYHGWTYALDGRLKKATRLAGIRNFSPKEYGLVPLQVGTWGPFVLLLSGGSRCSSSRQQLEEALREEEQLEAAWVGGDAAQVLRAAGVCDARLQHVRRTHYTLLCNWKVFCDNYLDGGYHVEHAHKQLAEGLHLPSYEARVFMRASIQTCHAAAEAGARLGGKATYAFVYPNFMINRYGPWMDTNLVLPLGPDKCRVVFDYFLHSDLVDKSAYIDACLEDSHKVQEEDIELCEGVQRGLRSPAFSVGRYAPRVEHPMHHFHRLLHRSLSSEGG
eukprot:jgi/Mesen1/1933/ME000146S01028